MERKRRLPYWLLVPFGASLCLLLGAAPPTARSDIDLKTPLNLTGDLLQKGLKLLKLHLVEINIEKLDLHLALGGGDGQQEVANLLKSGNELTERIGKEKNALLKQQLVVMQAHLD